VRLTVTLYAMFRADVGRRTVTVDVGAERPTVADALACLEREHPELSGRLLVDGEVPTTVTVLHDGRLVDRERPEVITLEPGDELSLAPPVTGGSSGRDR